MDKMFIAVNYNSVNNLDIGGSSSGIVRKRLPHVCFTSQTKTVQNQTGLITNVTIEWFTHFLNGKHAAEFSKIFDIFLRGSGRLKIDSNTLIGKFLIEGKFVFKIMFLFSGLFFIFSLSCFLKPPGTSKLDFITTLGKKKLIIIYTEHCFFNLEHHMPSKVHHIMVNYFKSYGKSRR